MHGTAGIRGLAPVLILLLLLPSQARATSTLPWMTPNTSAHYNVIVRNTPNMPIVAVANWTVLNVTLLEITFVEDGILGAIGSLGVSLISGGKVSLLGARVILNSDYSLTSRLCLRPCPLITPNEHAWEYIPSTDNSSLAGKNFDILSTTFGVIGDETLAPYNRTAWRLLPLVQVYLPALRLSNFWYDKDTGILLRADLFSEGDGNLTVILVNTTPNLGVQGLAVPLTSAQLSVILLLVLASYVLLAPRQRFRLSKSSLALS